MKIKEVLKDFKYVFSSSFCKQVKKAVIESQCKTGVSSFQWAYLRQGITPDEFVKYGFCLKDNHQRAEYMSHKSESCMFSKGEANHFPRNKYKRYEQFKDFFHRDILFVATSGEHTATEEQFQQFCSKHEHFIIKPVKGSSGRGIRIVSSDQFRDRQSLIDDIGDGLLIEELISQGKEIAWFHPNSINTIRFVSTMSPEEKYSILFVLLRVGVGGSIVDNVGAGGLVAMIDPATGAVCTDALCGTAYYECHPDTQVRFKGFAIPKWNEVCEIAEKAHRTMPQQRLIGWDFAWTSDGTWDMVEANPCPSFISYQTLSGCGIRRLLESAGILEE